jgi:phage pi2 protein 07
MQVDQVLEGTIHFKQPVPDGKLLVDKVEYSKMLDQSLTGRMWTIDDLRHWVGGKSKDWVKQYILYQPCFRADLDKLESQGYMHRSTGSGNPWTFKASVMSIWIDDHWNQINWNGKI